MGMYTEFKTKKLKLSKTTPPEIIQLLDNLINGDVDTSSTLPDHKFFTLPRWDRLFHTHHDHEMPSFEKVGEYWVLFLHADINHGLEEVEEFVDWVTPYVAGRKQKEFIGWSESEGVGGRINHYVKPQ